MSIPELKTVKVHINQVVYMPNIGHPPVHPYGFVYYITIENQSVHTVEIRARKWVVTDSDGEVLVVEGEGVVGEKPELVTGEAFTYNSCHVVAGNAKATGAFYGVIKETGQPFYTTIPEFELNVPPGA